MNVVSIDAAQARRVAYSVVLWQGAVTIVVALVSYAMSGRLAAVSALVGGGISTLASLVMAALSFRRSSLANAYSAVRPNLGMVRGTSSVVLRKTLFNSTYPLLVRAFKLRAVDFSSELAGDEQAVEAQTRAILRGADKTPVAEVAKKPASGATTSGRTTSCSITAPMASAESASQ